MKYTHNLISKYHIARIVKYAVNITYSVLAKVIGNVCHEKNILINAPPLYMKLLHDSSYLRPSRGLKPREQIQELFHQLFRFRFLLGVVGV